jgi:hypothetical protein
VIKEDLGHTSQEIGYFIGLERDEKATWTGSWNFESGACE